MRLFSCIALSLIGMFGMLPAQAQPQGERVLATVNDVPISSFDVRQRIRLTMIVQGIPELPPEAIPQFEQQALQELVEEQLKLQEAEEWELTIADEEIDQELAQIAASGGGNINSLVRDLNAQGVDVGTLRRRIRADKAWESLVRGRFGSRVTVTDGEIENMMDSLLARATEDQFLLSEICLPVNGAAEQEEMFNIGMQMIEQMRRGAAFTSLAQQYSACPSAARGGDLGWTRISELDPDLAAVVGQLAPGSVSRPVPQDSMMKMIAVRQTRPASAAGEPSYSVAYAGALISIGADEAESRMTRLAETNACNGDALSVDMGPNIGVTTLPILSESTYAPVFHDVLANMEIGDVSNVIESDGAYHVLMMCEKDIGYGLPPRRAVENQLRQDELDLLSRRYLRDVERDSAVEIRLTSQDQDS